MDKRIWISFGKVTKTEPLDTSLTADMVKVREGDASTIAIFDGVWVRGERSYSTYVLIDGIAAYHAPRPGLADMSFKEHERLGGGHSLP
ncbi:MAG: hypothetical protein Q8L08_08885 [Candidatus Nanopelagicaceae bacterium]|nr:hypothetical protein [Candidatus Nanopelagicaceae bacterium]